MLQELFAFPEYVHEKRARRICHGCDTIPRVYNPALSDVTHACMACRQDQIRQLIIFLRNQDPLPCKSDRKCHVRVIPLRVTHPALNKRTDLKCVKQGQGPNHRNCSQISVHKPEVGGIPRMDQISLKN
jgi:hypothetical protein